MSFEGISLFLKSVPDTGPILTFPPAAVPFKVAASNLIENVYLLSAEEISKESPDGVAFDKVSLWLMA